ncbi:MAG: nuclear transport factor 2 family protein [Pseudonocardiales bacterium]|nr:nuclear transport factor 2 family protein [Pseudonocardiales bacterium]
MINTEVVRACFESYLTQDRDSAESLIADDFLFTSPQDDHIDRAAFFERCFPTAGRVRTQELLHIVPCDGEDVFVMYEYELLTGERHRNVEVLTVRDSKVVEAQVFFGGNYSAV